MICLKKSKSINTLVELDLCRSNWNSVEAQKELATFIALAPKLKRCFIHQQQSEVMKIRVAREDGQVIVTHKSTKQVLFQCETQITSDIEIKC